MSYSFARWCYAVLQLLIISVCLEDWFEFHANNQSFFFFFLSFCTKTSTLSEVDMKSDIAFIIFLPLTWQKHPIIVRNEEKWPRNHMSVSACDCYHQNIQWTISAEEWRECLQRCITSWCLCLIYSLGTPPPPHHHHPSPEHSHSPLISTHTVDMQCTSWCYRHGMRSHLAFVSQNQWVRV